MLPAQRTRLRCRRHRRQHSPPDERLTNDRGFLPWRWPWGWPSDPFPYAEAEAELSVDIGVHELKAHVYRLASPEFLGRRGPGAARARPAPGCRLPAPQAAAGLRRLLLPADSLAAWPTRDPHGDSFVGRNVGAVLPGTRPESQGRVDHPQRPLRPSGQERRHTLPRRRRQRQRRGHAAGSGRALRPTERRSRGGPILFVAFDLEEAGLQGSTHFRDAPAARHPPAEGVPDGGHARPVDGQRHGRVRLCPGQRARARGCASCSRR